MIHSSCFASYDQADSPDLPDFPENFSSAENSSLSAHIPASPNTSKEGFTPTNWKQSCRTERPSECLICGNPANGYHYDVASCNGCKTFFRRVCLSEKSFMCKANGDCFDLTKRKHPLKCRSCRHQKCISVGMNPLAMEVDEKDASSFNFQKLTKRRKVKEEQTDEDDGYQVIAVINKPKLTIRNIESQENNLQRVKEMLVYLESKVEKFRSSAYNPDWNELCGIEYLLTTENRIGFGDRFEPIAWSQREKHQIMPLPSTNPGTFKGPMHSPDKRQWFFFNLMTNVEYAKTFMFFNRLDLRDKLVLIKHVTLKCHNLSQSYAAVAKKSEFPQYTNCSKQSQKDVEHYTTMVMSVAPLIRCQIQSIEYLLLKAICLCNPAVPDLSSHAQEILTKEREKYACALLDHCLQNRAEGPAHFAQLLQVIDVLERQQRMQKDFHLLHVAPIVARAPKGCVIRLIEDIMNS